MPGLGASFGRGAATTNLWDIANSDAILIMGSDMAECHPVGFRFVMNARRRGAKVVHVDPRFNRTAALSDLYVRIRPGTDIAFLGGLVNYVLQNDLWFEDFVLNYTNAPQLLRDDYQDTEELDGVFSGLDRDGRHYRTTSWQYKDQPVESMLAEHFVKTSQPQSRTAASVTVLERDRDFTLQNPRCVFQLLKRHFARYTPEVVASICGCKAEEVEQVARILAENSGRERTGNICYAVGWTQHTVGCQMIRAASILQSLLGNVGRPGGGIQALRGHPSIQGSTDIPTLFDLLPGYITQPTTVDEHFTLDKFLETETPSFGFWHDLPKFFISLLKAWYGDAATKENDFCYEHLPLVDDDYSQLPMTMAIHDGKVKGFLLIGQNPAVGGHNAGLVRKGLAQLDWMVVRDAFETESASFWYASPEARSGELDPHRIKTEVFFLPAALPGEKEGTFTNTQRLIQYHDRAIDPPGDARSDLWFAYHLGRRLKELYRDSSDPKDRPIQDLTWDYPTHGEIQEPSVDHVDREINGYDWATRWEDRTQLGEYTKLKDDGTTASGCWLYCGMYPSDGKNLTRNRTPDPGWNPGSHLGWGYSWPGNRRIMYNRCAADPDGKPWSERKQYVWWDERSERWVGYDVPDFDVTKRPDYRPAPGALGQEALSGSEPFTIAPDGRAWLYAPAGMKDGPMPTHYEPIESPVANLLYPRQQFSPVAGLFPRDDNRYARPEDPDYPYAICTYRLTEHHTGGVMTRWLPWLAELQPAGFAEISPELAAEKGVKNGDWVTVSSPRGEVEAIALVTGRMAPQRVNGKVVHTVGMPWHFGYMGIARGDTANTLSHISEDPNSRIHEGKVFVCNLRPGRKGGRR